MSEETASTPPASASAKSSAPGPKKKGPNLVLILVPVALVAALVLAFALPPTHALIVNGPLKPLFAKIGLAPAAGKPGSIAEKPADPAAEVKRLSSELETQRKAAADKDAQISQLQAQIAQTPPPAAQADASPTPAPKPSPTAVPEAIKRVAQYWAGMDAEKAADIAKQLPDDYVRAVFSQMPSDAVSDIMNAMPAKVAAKLTANPDAGEPAPAASP